MQDTELFKYNILKDQVSIDFFKSSTAKIFARFNFFSNILHSLKPNENGEWVPCNRLNAYIFGWPPDFKSKRTSDNEFLLIFNYSNFKQITKCINELRFALYNLKSKNINEAGGLSGKPILERSNEVIRYISEKSKGSIPIIGVGGIHSAQDAIDKINAGADLVQIYTGFIYEGPSLIRSINKALVEMN